MKLINLLKNIDYSSTEKIRNVWINNISADSRNVGPGDVFIALIGINTDGHKYLKDAEKRGACAVIVNENRNEELCCTELKIPVIKVVDTRAILPLILRNYYGTFEDMQVYGITGTNGKTTTAFFLSHILEKAGFRVARFGTTGHFIYGEEYVAAHTTPDIISLYKLFAEARKKGVNAVVMEVSSHAVTQKRIEGIQFNFGIFTNLGRDHLDYHGDMEAYFEAKLSFFTDYLFANRCNCGGFGCAINIDCNFGMRLYKRLSLMGTSGLSTYGFVKNAMFHILDTRREEKGMRVFLSDGKNKLSFKIGVIGRVNVYNSVAAFTAAVATGIPENIVIAALSDIIDVPGRYEFIDQGQPFSVIVDYAHTPEALECLLKDVGRYVCTDGRVITVFGCGGNRDIGKRESMGAIAAKNSDFVFITSDNPRWENQKSIAYQVERGVIAQKKARAPLSYTIVLDRREAIKKALEEAKPGDCVVIAGKGHEIYQEIDGVRYPFCDKEVIKEFLKGY